MHLILLSLIEFIRILQSSFCVCKMQLNNRRKKVKINYILQSKLISGNKQFVVTGMKKSTAMGLL